MKSDTGCIDESFIFELVQEAFVGQSKEGKIIIDYLKLLQDYYTTYPNHELIINLYRLYMKNGYLNNKQIAALIRFRGE